MEYFNIISVLILSFSSICYCDTFYYFAYGSNLLGKRLKLNSPSAEYHSVAVLENHRLDFNMYSETWNGAVATIVEDNATVTGVLWTIDMEDLPHLDKQEGLDKEGWYVAKNVTVKTLEGNEVNARTYQETNNPPKKRPCDDLPFERRPSNTYLEVLILGAVESGLPSDYIGYLVSFPTNGYQAGDSIRTQLGYPFGSK